MKIDKNLMMPKKDYSRSLKCKKQTRILADTWRSKTQIPLKKSLLKSIDGMLAVRFFTLIYLYSKNLNK